MAECSLPDELLDDESVTPLAKLTYWFIKRHGGVRYISDIARALRMDGQNPWLLIIELNNAGWASVPLRAIDCQGQRFTVHDARVATISLPENPAV